LIATLTALYLTAAFLGRKAGENIYRQRRGYKGSIFVGVGLALSCLAVSVTVAAVFIAADAWRHSVNNAVGYLVLSGVMMWVVGALPAILLGVFYGILVRRYLPKAEYGKEA
jgi:hypothetical protein